MPRLRRYSINAPWPVISLTQFWKLVYVPPIECPKMDCRSKSYLSANYACLRLIIRTKPRFASFSTAGNSSVNNVYILYFSNPLAVASM